MNLPYLPQQDISLEYMPWKKGIDYFLAAAHHATLAQAHGAKIIKSLQKTVL